MYNQLYLRFLLISFLISAFGHSAICQTERVSRNVQTQFKKPQGLFVKNNSENIIFSGANNNCAGAVNVPLNTQVIDNNTGATEQFPANLCNGATSDIANDVWFKFTYATGMDTLKVVPDFLASNDIVIELYDGDCSNLVFKKCSDEADFNQPNQTEGFQLSALGLTIGTTYYFRVFGYSGLECNFYALIKNSGNLPPPVNNVCASASTLTAGVVRSGTTIAAQQEIAPTNCGGSGVSSSANDVWYKFTKTSFMDTLVVFPSGSENFALEIRSNVCSGGTSISCANAFGIGGIEKLPLSSLTNGTIYLARVYGFNGSVGNFSIKIKSAPSNNNCTGATTLVPSLNCTPISGTTVDASQNLPAILCNNSTGAADDDVWYSFVMVEGLDTIRVIPSALFDAVVDIRSGNCSSSSSILCSDRGGANVTEKIFVGSLSIGTSYFVRVYGKGQGQGFAGNFTICLRQGSLPPPSNDNCTAAISLVTATTTNGTSQNATQTAASVACGGAGSTIMNDVWYSFTKTATTDTIEFNGLGALDVLFDVRANTCPTGSIQACNDEAGTDAKKTDIGYLINGTTYLLRVYGRNGAKGTFSIKFIDAIIVVTPPANDDCFDAIPLTMGSTCSLVAGSNEAGTETLAAGSCAGPNAGSANDVWYSFTATNARAFVKIFGTVGLDGVIEAYSGSCFGPVSLGCINQFPASIDPDFPTVEELFLQGLSIGQQYFIRVYGKSGTTGAFSICVYNPNCNSTAGVLSSSISSIVSNQAFTVQVSGSVETFAYETSTNQVNWTVLPGVNSLQDTLVGKAAANSILYIRASNRTGSCFPTYSNIVPVTIRCATQFSNLPGLNRITRVTLGSIDNGSAENPLGGNVQDFSQSSTSLCRGNSSLLGITVGNTTSAINRMAWIDFNQDGDFADVGENVLNGAYSSGATVSNSITIPANASIGSSRLRIAIINNGSSINSADACFVGPYASGEIEEYTVNISAGLAANPINLGKDTTICKNVTPSYTLIGPPNMAGYSWSTGSILQQITVSDSNTYTLSVNTVAGCDFKDTVLVKFAICTESNQFLTTNEFVKLSPNPSFGKAFVDVEVSNSEMMYLKVFDIKGLLISDLSIIASKEHSRIELPSNLRTGMYIVKVSGKDFTKTIKWLVQK